MYCRFFSIPCAWLASFLVATAQPVISEFMAQNSSTLTDEDGDYSDWIEIHNPTSAPVDLEGWGLTDRADQPGMWTFPAVILEPGEHLLVFASNKDRRVPGQQLHTNFAISVGGEYLGLIGPDGETVGTEFAPSFPPQITDVSYGTTSPAEWVELFGKGSPARIHAPQSSALGNTWREPAFDDSSWRAGTLAVGFKVGTSDPAGLRDLIETDVQDLMYDGRPQTSRLLSVYVRVPFLVDDPAEITGLELRIQSDDGFAAFLNGGSAPVHQFNAPATLQWNSPSTATVYDEDGLPTHTADLTGQLDRLVPGANVLSIHGMNANTGSSDLLVAPQLWARLPSSEPPRTGYFLQPTPGARNPGNDGLMLTETVTFSHPAGTFTGTLQVSLSGAGEGQSIRYTTNGSAPTPASPVYNGPLTLNATTLLRAAVFDAGGSAGRTSTAHYLRLSSALANRRSNLPMVVLDARGQTLNDVTRRAGYFLLFDRNQDGISSLADAPAIATRQGIRWRGSSSLQFPKKPYSVEFWDETDESLRIPVLGMTEEQDWVFYAPYRYDRSFTRNSIAYDLSRQMGRWAPNTRFVEVFYNENGGDLGTSDYVGVYAIVEQIKMNSRRLGHSVIEPSQIPPDGPIDPLAQGPWTGGYLFKIDRSDPDEYRWRTTRGFPPTENITLNRPKLPNLDGGPYANSTQATAGSRQVAYLRQYVQAFEDALYSDQSGNFANRSHLQYIDRDTWVDHLLLNTFTKNVDGLRLSAFFHKAENLKLRAGPIWDFDRSMNSHDGRDSSPTGWYGSGGAGDSTPYFQYGWWGVLSQDPDFAQDFYDRWASLRQTVFSDANLTGMVISMSDEISNSENGLGSAAARDAARWPEYPPVGANYQNETQRILTWILDRAEWMDRRRIDAGLLPAPPQIANNSSTITLTAAETIYYTLDGTDPRASGGAIAGQTYSSPFPLGSATTLIARSRTASGIWSTPALLATDPPATAPVFLPAGNGDWTDNANWSTAPAPYPDAAGATAIVGSPASGNRNVDLRSPVTIGSLHFPQEDASGRNRVRDQGTGNSITFDNGASPALLSVGGTGAGFVEFEIVSGAVLQSTLELDITNIAGDPEYGALRLRETWSGPGGLVKRGPGVATFTGEDKLYSGPTRIEEGVLRVTGPSTMPNTPSVTVLDGGQLRLISASSPGNPRVHTFGGDLFLSGSGRGGDIPESSGLGVLGALRYDPGSDDNHAIVTNDIEFPEPASIHIDGPTNLLELTGGLRGPGSLSKSGGGTLAISGDRSSYTSPVGVSNGTLLLRGSLGSPISIGDVSALNAAGTSGPLSGSNGGLILPATTLSTPGVSGLRHSFVFTRAGLPDPTDPTASGNALLVTGNPGVPQAIDLYLDLAEAPTASSIVQGGYLLPAGASWSPILDHSSIRLFLADAEGTHPFLGQTWTLNTGAVLTSVPVSQGTLQGRMLEIRFDGSSVTYESWKQAFFDPAQASDPLVSAPGAEPFGDGIANLLRYALGADAGAPLPGLLPRLSHDGANVGFTFPYNPRLRGLRWIVEATPDLTDWDQAEILFDSQTSLDLPDSGGLLTLEDTTSASRRFYRLRVVEDPTR